MSEANGGPTERDHLRIATRPYQGRPYPGSGLGTVSREDRKEKDSGGTATRDTILSWPVPLFAQGTASPCSYRS